MDNDVINSPPHYTSHPSGVECITVTEHMNFCLGNAMKYLWRHRDKGKPREDLKKAVWYIDREIARRAGPEFKFVGRRLVFSRPFARDMMTRVIAAEHGNVRAAMAHLWSATVEDYLDGELRRARDYINKEIKRLERGEAG